MSFFRVKLYKIFPIINMLRFDSITANVSRLKNVAKMQHQAITNITKTLN